MLTDRSIATGFTIPLPEMSGAEPVHNVSVEHALHDSMMHTMDGLVDTVHLRLAIWNGSQTRAWEQTKRSRNDTCLVTDDVAEQVACDDDAVESPWVFDH